MNAPALPGIPTLPEVGRPDSGVRSRTGPTPADDAQSLAGLLDDAVAYRSSTRYRDLLRFVARMRRFSPFNAMLLHRQKPG